MVTRHALDVKFKVRVLTPQLKKIPERGFFFSYKQPTDLFREAGCLMLFVTRSPNSAKKSWKKKLIEMMISYHAAPTV